MAKPRAADGARPAPAVPWPQLLLDDMFFLIAVGIAVPLLLYIVWGLWELAELPVLGG